MQVSFVTICAILVESQPSHVYALLEVVVRASLLISPAGYSNVVARIQTYVCTQTKKVWTHSLTRSYQYKTGCYRAHRERERARQRSMVDLK